MDTVDVLQLRQLAFDNIDLFLECGITKPIPKFELSDKVNIVQAIALHKVILGSMAELAQFKEGVSAHGVGDAIKDHPDLLHSYYCTDHHDTLTSGMNVLFYETCSS